MGTSMHEISDMRTLGSGLVPRRKGNGVTVTGVCSWKGRTRVRGMCYDDDDDDERGRDGI